MYLGKRQKDTESTIMWKVKEGNGVKMVEDKKN